MTKLLRAFAAFLALPLALALAACGSSDDSPTAPPTGEPIAAIPAPAGQSWMDTVEVTPEDGYRYGNPDAPIKLVEYQSHTCPHCGAFAAEAGAALKDKYVASGVVSWEIREQLHNPIDLLVAVLARCGAKESFLPLSEQYWSNLEPMIERAQANQAALAQAQNLPPNQRFQQMAEAAGLIDFFSSRGIAREQALQCLADGDKVQAIADRSEKQSEELNVTGTPTFFINGRKIENVAAWSGLEPALQAAGAR
jgi:protein-disulfide isomerase